MAKTKKPRAAKGPTVDEWRRAATAEAAEDAVPADSPEALAAWDAESAKVIGEKETEVSALEADHEDKKALAKSAKEALELGERELRCLIRERREGRGKPVMAPLFPESEAHERNGEVDG